MSPLDSFVRECLARRIPRDAIRAKLIEASWGAEEIDAALAEYAEVEFDVPVPRRRAYLSARETFFYLVLFATLYTSALSAGRILFLLIERFLPDPLWAPEAALVRAEQARGAAASLLIAFPAFMLATRTIGRMLGREPVKRGSRIRKWLTYLTLFVAAMVLVGNLIVLVTGLLSGEISARFALKVLVVFLIAGTVFAHYSGDLRREERATPLPSMRAGLLARISVVVTVLVMAAGLFAAGSPREARMRRLDLDRVEALRRIFMGVEAYHRRHGMIPASLDSVMLDPDTFASETIADPVTRVPYEYRVLDAATGRYELCAVFQAADSTGGRGGPFIPSGFWNHGSGRHCYTITVGRVGKGNPLEP